MVQCLRHVAIAADVGLRFSLPSPMCQFDHWASIIGVGGVGRKSDLQCMHHTISIQQFRVGCSCRAASDLVPPKCRKLGLALGIGYSSGTPIKISKSPDACRFINPI